MANSANTLPVVLDTDLSSLRAVMRPPASGLRVYKIALVVGSGSVSSAGAVVITEPNSGIALYPPLAVSASTPANTILFTDNLDNQQLQWRDISVTGLTATKTQLYIWARN